MFADVNAASLPTTISPAFQKTMFILIYRPSSGGNDTLLRLQVGGRWGQSLMRIVLRANLSDAKRQ
jgi:hypothetical protein